MSLLILGQGGMPMGVFHTLSNVTLTDYLDSINAGYISYVFVRCITSRHEGTKGYTVRITRQRENADVGLLAKREEWYGLLST